LKTSISVVIPAYNRAATIAYCLDSVCNQTVAPDEIIVVDDCSTDGTADVVSGYARSHPTVRCVVLERNSGSQAARNRGIAEAMGAWIAFQDSDDEWIPDKLEKQVAALSKLEFEPMTVVHADAWRHDDDTGVRTEWHLPSCEGEAIVGLLQAPGPVFPAIVASKKALQKIGLLDERVPSYQEWDTAIRLAKLCRFVHIREPLIVYHLHGGETISKDRKRIIDGYQFVVEKHRDAIVDVCGARIYARHIEANTLRAMRWGYFAEARDILARVPGNSRHIDLLKWMAAREVRHGLLDVLLGILRRLSY